MRFQVNDIVASGPGYSQAAFVIVAIHPSRPKNPYDGVSLANGKTYRFGDDTLAPKRIGVADAGWNSTPAQSNLPFDQNWLNGARRATQEAVVSSGDSQKRWQKLANLKPGDKFLGRVRGKLDTLTFRQVTERGYKYVFVATNSNGTTYKYPLGVVVVEGETTFDGGEEYD